jgi:hypothetical protein
MNSFAVGVFVFLGAMTGAASYGIVGWDSLLFPGENPPTTGAVGYDVGRRSRERFTSDEDSL